MHKPKYENGQFAETHTHTHTHTQIYIYLCIYIYIIQELALL